MRLIIVIAGAALASACTSMRVSQNLASGAVGCQPDEIVIEGEDVHRNVHTFRATCKGQAYYCTYMYPNPINCKEATD